MKQPVIIEVESSVEPCAGEGARLKKIEQQQKLKPQMTNEQCAEAMLKGFANIMAHAMFRILEK